jgi:hypothetical protein
MAWGCVAAAILAGLIAAPANAAGLCKRRNGVIVVRERCRRDESAVNLADFGAVGPKGDKGETGADGPPGPFVDTVPSGKTLRGSWAIVSNTAESSGTLATQIAFGLPLAAAPVGHVAPAAECTGTFELPTAAPGHLCVYQRAFQRAGTASVALVRSFGALITVSVTTGGGPATSVFADGSWAVTAP